MQRSADANRLNAYSAVMHKLRGNSRSIRSMRRNCVFYVFIRILGIEYSIYVALEAGSY